MSENTNVNVVITADDHASPVIRRLKAEMEGLRRTLDRSFKQSPANAFMKGLKDLEQVARQQNQAAAAMQRQVKAVRDLAGANRQAAASYRIAESAGVRSFQRQMAFASRMSRQRAAEDRAEERAHRSRIGRLEREHRLSLRNASAYGRRSYQNLRGMDFRTPAMMAAAGTGAAALAARRILTSEADTDAAEKNTIAYGGLSRDAARALREQWAGPLSVQLGATTAQMLAGYTEALKVGIPSEGAKAFSELAIKTSEAWSLPVEAVTDTLGIINQTLTAAGQAFDYKKLHSVANGIQHLAAKMATTPEKMISFLQRGAGAAALLGMSQEAGLAFGAASTSLGNQAAESGRMFDYVAGRLIELPRLTRQSGIEGDQARAMVRALGYGSAEQIERQRRANPDDFLFEFIERFNRIRNPKKRDEAIRFFAGREWLGEFGRMVTGSATLREAQKLAKESKGLDAIGQVWAVHQTKLLFVAKQIKAGFLSVLGEFGMVLSPIARQVGDFFLRWSAGLKNSGLKRKFEAALDGFIQGLGFKDITGLLEGIFGIPGNDAQDTVERWRNIARAFGEGIRSAADQILSVVRALSSATGSGENLTRWATYLTTWATAINIASPAFSILGTLAAPFLAFGNALAAFLNIITAARLSAAVSALSAAGAGSAAGTAVGTAAAGGAAGTIARLFPWLAAGGALGYMVYSEAKRRDPNGNAFGKNDIAQRMREEERRRAEERRRMFGPPVSPDMIKGSGGENDLKGGAGDDLLRSVDRLNYSFKEVGSRLQLAALTNPGMFSDIRGSYSGGGSYSAATVSPDVSNLFTPPAVPDYGLGRSGIIRRDAPKKLLDIIAQGEVGTLGPEGYKRLTGQYRGPWSDVTKMTVDQVIAFQKNMKRNYGVTDSAVGRYQINGITLEDFKRRLGLTGNEMFDGPMQDRIAGAIAQSTGGNINRLRGRWTALRKVPTNVIQEALGASAPVAGGVHPLDGQGRLTSGFGMRKHPISGAFKMHKGIDLAAPAGTAVKAMKEGVVELVNRWGDVTLKHLDGTSTTYRHINAMVEKGQKIMGGGIIGKLRANDPRSTGPHLHLEGTNAAGKLIDPRALISGVPTAQDIVRDVPVTGPSNNAQSSQGSSAPVIHLNNNFHGPGNPEEIASAIQRQVTTAMSYRTHDVETGLV